MRFRVLSNVYIHLGVHDGLNRIEAVFDRSWFQVGMMGLQLLSRNYDDRRRVLQISGVWIGLNCRLTKFR